MYNNKQYNTRNSGRFNTPGQFVPAAEQQNQQQFYPGTPRPPRQGNQQQHQQQHQQQQQPQQPPMQTNVQEPPIQEPDVPMNTEQPEVEEDTATSKNENRPAWMKSRLAGVNKISNKERRRRQNEMLRRLLTPKNALMVLNEMLPHEQLTTQFQVEAAASQFFSRTGHNFCADLSLEGSNYKGYGENKLSARNAAAEQAIRDLIIKKMNKVLSTDVSSQNGEETVDEESLPMIQLASFALHKLFTEWEGDGHKVPQLRPNSSSVSEAGAVGEGVDTGAGADAGGEAGAVSKKPKPQAPKVRTLPVSASSMHPSTLLSYMRPGLEYRELAIEGDKPQNMVFTMGVDVDGATYIGKGGNKKEARRAAARSACVALFDVKFEQEA